MRYQKLVFDSARWDGFEFRSGDIVISTPPKCGTTWTQMLCALLIFDGPDFPAPLEKMSPWLDMLNRPIEDVRATYAAQEYRRFIKTHTPLDGLPLHEDVTYVVVGRDPRDVSISMEHHTANVDFDRFMALRATVVESDGAAELSRRLDEPDDPVERFRQFVDVDDLAGRATLSSVLHHLDTAWQRRAAPNIALFHYADYQADLPGEMLRLANALEIELSPVRAVELAPEAGLARMRERADDVVPSASMGTWKSTVSFLRAGATGEWRERATDADLLAYDERVAELVAPDLAAWAHRGRIATGIDPGTA